MKAMQKADGKVVGSVVRGGGGIRETGWSLLRNGRQKVDTGRDGGKGARDRMDGGLGMDGSGRGIQGGASDAGNGGGGVLGGVWDGGEGGRSFSEGVQSVPNRRRNVPDGVFHTAKLIRNVPGISFDAGNGVGNGRFGRAGTGFLKTQRRGGAEGEPTASARLCVRIAPAFAHALSRGLGSSTPFRPLLRPRRNSAQDDGRFGGRPTFSANAQCSIPTPKPHLLLWPTRS